MIENSQCLSQNQIMDLNIVNAVVVVIEFEVLTYIKLLYKLVSLGIGILSIKE
jgi:hypothetical protein